MLGFKRDDSVTEVSMGDVRVSWTYIFSRLASGLHCGYMEYEQKFCEISKLLQSW